MLCIWSWVIHACKITLAAAMTVYRRKIPFWRLFKSLGLATLSGANSTSNGSNRSVKTPIYAQDRGVSHGARNVTNGLFNFDLWAIETDPKMKTPKYA
jgi:hypothetical protein